MDKNKNPKPQFQYENIKNKLKESKIERLKLSNEINW